MNVQETSEIRQLSAGEIDEVAGGLFWARLLTYVAVAAGAWVDGDPNMFEILESAKKGS
jgi:hypothetical protein